MELTNHVAYCSTCQAVIESLFLDTAEKVAAWHRLKNPGHKIEVSNA